MKNVFIAVGGSGTRVAEMLVRMLAAGFPTRRDQNGILTSAGDSLQIWRVDTSRSAKAGGDLKDALKDYSNLQRCLTDAASHNNIASSNWAIDVESIVRDLDPLALPDNAGGTKKLGGVLGSQSAAHFLKPFYAESDLQVMVDKGFYQRPYIGSAVMSVFAKSLEDPNSPGGAIARLTALDKAPANFLLCGSLHGGTGACGVPVLGKFLTERRQEGWQWRVGACLLDPYFYPTKPPFKPLDTSKPGEARLAEILTKHYGQYAALPPDVQRVLNGYVNDNGNHPAFASLPNEAEKHELAWQVLLGFCADADSTVVRAKQGLEYFRRHSGKDFDEVYLVGKDSPTQYDNWSNGGATERNPLNSTEFVAALAALEYFSGAKTGDRDSYVIASADADLPDENYRLRHLPTYKIGVEPGGIDPERVYLSTAMLHFLVLNEIDWNLTASALPKTVKLREIYANNDTRKSSDRQLFTEALRLINNSLTKIIDPTQTVGWQNEDLRELNAYLSDNPTQIEAIKKRLGRSYFSGAPKGENILGDTMLKFTSFDFGSWCPRREAFTRGGYLRLVWNELYARCKPVVGR